MISPLALFGSGVKKSGEAALCFPCSSSHWVTPVRGNGTRIIATFQFIAVLHTSVNHPTLPITLVHAIPEVIISSAHWLRYRNQRRRCTAHGGNCFRMEVMHRPVQRCPKLWRQGGFSNENRYGRVKTGAQKAAEKCVLKKRLRGATEIVSGVTSPR